MFCIGNRVRESRGGGVRGRGVSAEELVTFIVIVMYDCCYAY